MRKLKNRIKNLSDSKLAKIQRVVSKEMSKRFEAKNINEARYSFLIETMPNFSLLEETEMSKSIQHAKDAHEERERKLKIIGYKLIKEYPESLPLGTKLRKDILGQFLYENPKDLQIFTEEQVSGWPEYWKPIYKN